MRKIGLFGGTFDPVHCGHLKLAKKALQEIGLQRILFIPAAYPPHKDFSVLTPYADRVKMLELALEGENHFSISEIEKHLSQPSYTIDMLDYLHACSQRENDYYFMIGADAFLEIPSWKKYRKVLEMVHFIIFARPGYNDTMLFSLLNNLGYISENTFWKKAGGKQEIRYVEEEISEISSSIIRNNIMKRRDIEKLVPVSVKNYIEIHKLYI